MVPCKREWEELNVRLREELPKPNLSQDSRANTRFLENDMSNDHC